MHDGPAFYAGFLGAIKIGAVPIPINTMFREADYRFILNDSRANASIVSEPLTGEILPILHLLPWLKHLIVSDGATAGLPSLEALLDGASPTLAAAETHKDEPAFWRYSPAILARPKARFTSNTTSSTRSRAMRAPCCR